MVNPGKRKLHIGQLNFNHCRAAMAQVSVDIFDSGIDILLLNEPYFFEGRISGLPSSFAVIFELGAPRTGILISPSIKYFVILARRDLTVVQVEWNGEQIILVSIYQPPSEDLTFDGLEFILNKYTDYKIVISGYFNAKSGVWSPRDTDTRGEEVLALVDRWNLSIWNNPNSNPTYNSTLGESWIDLTLSSGFSDTEIHNWQVKDLITLSDHQLITFEIGLDDHVNVKKQDYYGLKTLDSFLWRNNLNWLKEELEQIDFESLKDNITLARKKMVECCQLSIRKHRKARKMVNNPIWWKPSFRIIRSQIRALRRRYQAIKDNLDLRNFWKEKYKIQRAKYKKIINDAKRESFRDYLNSITKTDPFGAIKPILNRKKKIVSNMILLDNGLYTKSIQEAQNSIINHFFRTTEVIDFNSDLFEDHFTIGFNVEEIELVFKEVGENKAPGIDGLTFGVLKDIFKTNREYFCQVFNRCLTLSYFPIAWKKAKVILIPKENKDSSQPSSYRPICLLPCWGKVLDKLLNKLLFRNQ